MTRDVSFEDVLYVDKIGWSTFLVCESLLSGQMG